MDGVPSLRVESSGLKVQGKRTWFICNAWHNTRFLLHRD
jgi:hypothetical protein